MNNVVELESCPDLFVILKKAATRGRSDVIIPGYSQYSVPRAEYLEYIPRIPEME